MRALVVPTLLSLMCLAPRVAQAHQRLVYPPSRSLDDFLTEGPCGAVARTGEVTTLTAGDTIDLQWTLSQNHNNTFRVAFSPAADEGFEANIIGTLPDVSDQYDYSQAIALPECVCDDCTLQVAQFTPTGNAAYYSCADIQLVPPEGMNLPSCDEVAGTTAGSEPEPEPEPGTSGPGQTGTDTAGPGSPDSGQDQAGCNLNSGNLGGPGIGLLWLLLAASYRRRDLAAQGEAHKTAPGALAPAKTLHRGGKAPPPTRCPTQPG